MGNRQIIAELETICKLARVVEMNPSDLLGLAECRSAQLKRASVHSTGEFDFSEVANGNIRCLMGTSVAGGKVSCREIHQDDHEVCRVIEGRLRFYLPNEQHELSAGQAIQFDALLEHSCEATLR